MSMELELLSTLYAMYKEGELASKFNKITNKLENSSELDNIMLAVKQLLPEELEPIEAAEKMRELTEVERTEAIDSSDKVIDLRLEFRRKMSNNGGALGLVQKFVESTKNGDDEACTEILEYMTELVDQSKPE